MCLKFNWHLHFAVLIAMVFLLHVFALPSFATSYQYDGMNRLTQATFDDGTYLEYKYDKIGNMIAKTYHPNYLISTSNGSNGAISPSATKVLSGGSVTFSITPFASFNVVDVSVDGSSQGPITGYTFSNVTSNHSISAIFAIDQYPITFIPGSNGSLTGNTIQVLNYGSDASQVTAVPSPGYVFYNWTGTGSFTPNNINPLILSNVTSTQTITANFTIANYPVTFLAALNGNQAIAGVNYISGATAQNVNYNSSTSAVTAMAPPGYNFVNWTGTNGFVPTNANPLVISNVTSGQQITANFTYPVRIVPPIPVNSTPVYYTTIQDAYNAAVDGDVIQCQAQTFMGDFTVNMSISVTLDGGYSADYASKAGTTGMKGALTTTSAETAIVIKDFILTN